MGRLVAWFGRTRGVPKLAWAGIVVAPQRATAAVAGHGAALALIAASPVAGRLDVTYEWSGLVLVATVAAGAASAVDRRELRAAATAGQCGASRGQRRLVVVAEAVLLAMAALPLGLIGGGVIGGLVAGDLGGPPLATLLFAALVVPALVAPFAGRLRTRVTVVDATGDHLGRPALPRRLVDGLRMALGLTMVAWAIAMATRIRSFFGLDLVLPILLGAAVVGLFVLLPPLVGTAGSVLARSRRLPVALAGTVLQDRRRLLAPAAAVGTVAAFLVAVEAVAGLGLADREEARRQQLTDTYRFTAGLDDETALIGRIPSGPGALYLGDGTVYMGDGTVLAVEGGPGVGAPLPSAMADRVRAAAPGAVVAEVVEVPAGIAGDPVVSRRVPRRVAVASPELLRALDLGELASDLAAGRALALDPSAVREGRVRFNGEDRSMPATVVQDRAVPQYLPAVLVPDEAVAAIATEIAVDSDGRPDPGRTAGPTQLIVGQDHALSNREMTDIRKAVHGTVDDVPGDNPLIEVMPGDRPIAGVFDQGRLDESYSLVLDSIADVRLAVSVTLVVALVALGVALRLADLTGRSDDELLDVLGAPAPLLRRASATQALVLAALAVPLGTAVGILACRIGLAAYNGSSAVGPGALPPIPFVVPSELIVGAIVVPLAATALAWALAYRRRAPDLQAMADGLAW
jgi:hypothetical protein